MGGQVLGLPGRTSAIALIGIRSDRCNRRISAQSSTRHHILKINRGVQIRPMIRGQSSQTSLRRVRSSRWTALQAANRGSPGDVIGPNSTVLNWPEAFDSDVRSCPSLRQSRSSSINRASLHPEVMRELVEHDVSDLAA